MRLSRRALEPAVIAALLLGVALLCQPVSIALFRAGFFVTLSGAIAFVVVSHLPEAPHDE